ncbi:RpiB/LacA/LacB family sugar-phosphate isomerase [Streptomyces sp. CA-135486]|uniref:RpiB/LacA/LacB family sugar-phosphate isomerase n=1 Tax=Streptomyces sp. CA-135486 TaxID=3240049 RepID=UPI003D8B2110
MLYMAGDHYAADFLRDIEQYLTLRGIEYQRLPFDGTAPLQEIIPALVQRVRSTSSGSGILACGTGIGVTIGANRFPKIRAALCVQPQQAKFARVYDDANVLCLGSWTTTNPEEVLDAWFGNEFDGDADRRLMIEEFDAWS